VDSTLHADAAGAAASAKQRHVTYDTTHAAAVSIFFEGTLHASRVVMTWLVLDSGMSAEYTAPLHSTL
jgi:hypothetical protein